MKKNYWWQSWSRFFLWSHVVGVIGFYLILWWRTLPGKNHQVRVQPLKKTLIAPLAANKPLVSIIVPARNEERNIYRCVTSLLEQDYENFEVIAVDDGSADMTGNILAQLRQQHPQGRLLRVVRLDELPEGWAGKPHAIHAGTQEARGTWLLLTDADTWHAPNALRSALTQAIDEQLDLFTLESTQELPGFWERTLMPMAFMGIGMLYPPKKVNDPASPLAIANGQYILIRREVYDIIGGYARPDLRQTLVDDRDLARVIKETGFKMRFVRGAGLVHVHMYHGLAETWSGWRKNVFLGNRGGLPFYMTQLLGLPIIAIIPFLLPVLAWFTRILAKSSGKSGAIGSIGAREAMTATILELIPLFAYRLWINRAMGVPWYYVLTYPISAIVFMGILGQSAWRVLTRQGVDWRGRQYHNGKKTSVEVKQLNTSDAR